MKALLIVTAVLEVSTGVVLAAAPSLPVSLLLGAPLDGPAATSVARIAGAALLSLGVVCWTARGESRGLLAALLLYNLAAVAVLSTSGLGPETSGVLVWPAVSLHAALALWCTLCLRSSP